MDWRHLANTYPFYNVAAKNTKLVGILTASLLNFLVDQGNAHLKNFHPIGFSLGAQVAGHLGYKLGGKLSRITGMYVGHPKLTKTFLIAAKRVNPG